MNIQQFLNGPSSISEWTLISVGKGPNTKELEEYSGKENMSKEEIEKMKREWTEEQKANMKAKE